MLVLNTGGHNPRTTRYRTTFDPILPVEKKNFHLGRYVKRKLRELRIRDKDLIEGTGIPKSTFYSAMKAPTMDTGMLGRISEYANYNFFLAFVEPKELKKLFDETPFVNPVDYNKVIVENRKFKSTIERQEKEYKELNKKYTRLLESILNEDADIEKKIEKANFRIIENT